MGQFVDSSLGLKKPSGCVSTSGLLLGLIVNVTILRLHLFLFVLWLWLALPENKPVYCWIQLCCGFGPLQGSCLILCGVVVAIDASALLFKTYGCYCNWFTSQIHTIPNDFRRQCRLLSCMPICDGISNFGYPEEHKLRLLPSRLQHTASSSARRFHCIDTQLFGLLIKEGVFRVDAISWQLNCEKCGSSWIAPKGPALSGGVSSTLSPVNSESK